MNKEDREKLFLTQEEVDPYIYGGGVDTEGICSEQIDKVFNQPWLDKPDSTCNWWKSVLMENGTWSKPIWWGYIIDPIAFMVIDNVKWQKAIVPIPPSGAISLVPEPPKE